MKAAEPLNAFLGMSLNVGILLDWISEHILHISLQQLWDISSTAEIMSGLFFWHENICSGIDRLPEQCWTSLWLTFLF